jgi:Tol biopolymer transport system component
MAQPSPAHNGEPSSALVRAELDRILASEFFVRSDRLSAFLRFIVDATLKGDGATLKEHVIAVGVYGKGTDFDTAADPIVRVDARRLRDKLREYYASAPPGEIVISVPKGSYTPVFSHGAAAVDTTVTGSPDEAAAALGGQPTTRVRWSRWGAIAVGGALAVALLPLVTSMTRSRMPAPRLLTVTSFPGAEDNPEFSPDGNFIAFSWAGPEGGDSDDLWVTAVDGSGLRRLTTGAPIDKWPRWSPDGRQIAFTRRVAGRPTVVLISPLGGPERVVIDGSTAEWTPDSRALVAATGNPAAGFLLEHLTLESGARRQLTKAPAGFMDIHPRVSPDGATVAFLRYGAGRSAIFVVPVGGGEPRAVVDWVSGNIAGLTWMPDGREIIYARPETSGRYFVRTTLDGSRSSPVNGVPFGSTSPVMPRTRQGSAARLGFASGHVDTGLRLIDLTMAATSQTVEERVFADATRMDKPGRFSPDGQHVAFVSDRGGSQQVWIAGMDGSGLRSLTGFEQATLNVGSFSPDGQSVVFDATVGGDTDLYTVRIDGSGSRRLTQGAAIESDAEWSRDGRWIYYSSNASGTQTIWKLPASGAPPVQVTTEQAFEPRESPDGRIFFINGQRVFGRRVGPLAVKEVSRDGGQTTVVLSDVVPGAWDVADSGIYFLPNLRSRSANPGTRETVMRYDFRDRQVHPAGTLRFPVADAWVDRFFIVSRDGRHAMASHVDRFERDIMVLDNFR